VAGLDPSAGQDVAVPHVWELSTGALDEAGNARYLELEPEEDGTRRLSRSGVLRLALPAAGQIGVPENDPRRALRAGVGDNPPRVDDPALAARLVGWLRLRLNARPALQHFSVRWAGVHATGIAQREALGTRLLGNGDGGSAQQFSLGVGNVDAERLVLAVEDPQRGFVDWTRVDDLGNARPDDRLYELDAEAGLVRFGDGIHGAVPPAGARVRASQIHAGGGSAGNLPAQTLQRTRLGTADLRVFQPLPLQGGAEAETLEEAERRIPAALRHRERAVTAADYRDLLRALPRGDVGRVEVLPRFKPHERESEVPGVVSVMVWPAQPAADFRAPAPRADRLLLEAAHAWLEPRRPLATELYVMGCEYIGLGLAIAVRVADGFAAEQVLPAVRLALRRHLWVLPGGGPDGEGWPQQRAVDNRELEVVAARVPGVDATTDVQLFREVSRQPGAPRWQRVAFDAQERARIPLERWQWPELLAVSVIEGDSAAASPDGDAGLAPPDGGGAAVPLVPEVC
jgi:predicted phage baseplate assembly protein